MWKEKPLSKNRREKGKHFFKKSRCEKEKLFQKWVWGKNIFLNIAVLRKETRFVTHKRRRSVKGSLSCFFLEVGSVANIRCAAKPQERSGKWYCSNYSLYKRYLLWHAFFAEFAHISTVSALSQIPIPFLLHIGEKFLSSASSRHFRKQIIETNNSRGICKHYLPPKRLKDLFSWSVFPWERFYFRRRSWGLGKRTEREEEEEPKGKYREKHWICQKKRDWNESFKNSLFFFLGYRFQTKQIFRFLSVSDGNLFSVLNFALRTLPSSKVQKIRSVDIVSFAGNLLWRTCLPPLALWGGRRASGGRGSRRTNREKIVFDERNPTNWCTISKKIKKWKKI